MRIRTPFVAAKLGLALILATATVAAADETPKHGGTLIYMIPADSPPSLDGHRETTYATVHATAPFYSVLIRINPEDPNSSTDFVCDLCTEMPNPTDNGKTYTFRIRDGVKWHDGSALTAYDVAASWQEIVHPRPGVSSARESYFIMVDTIEAPDPATVVFHLKFATSAFLPALADPFAYTYKQEILDRDPHWFEKNVMGSGPFKFVEYQIGQSIKGVRNPEYYHKGLPYLDGFTAIFADKQSVRLDAIRADRAALEFRGLPPSARDQLVKELGDKITVQTGDWNCVNMITPNHKKKPFDDVRVRRALTLAIDQWHGAPALSKIANVHTVGGIVFPGSPLAANKEELQQIAGYWPDIEKSRAEARRLLHEAGAEGLTFELLNRNVDQPYKYIATWVIDEWSKIGLHVKQRVLPTGPFFDALRNNAFDVTVDFNCQGLVNPLLDVGKFLPHSVYTENYGNYDDQKDIDLYRALLYETDPIRQRVGMREYETYVLDTQAHMYMMPWWERIVPMRAYVKGWKISPSHYVNQDLATVWLDN
ncbi:MAG: peptide/nickel transport system substrate-binding protein [Acetobacteraceae bacterium]|jgi:peptide/nickel transport system substrate-binding protein|nr:peptide/nickel transport system substrate-binding protein [Acetobacteraceae bacterium]